MFERKQCPECGDWHTERVHVEWLTDGVDEIRICNDCPTQYTISYGNPYVESEEVPT